MFQVTEAWKAAYSGAAVGALALRAVANPDHNAALDERKEALEEALRARWAGQDRKALAALPVIQAYSSYYARFRKTYHVLPQLESVALKGRPLPRVAALVEAMFMAELKNQLLTAGHDAGVLQLPVVVDIATGNERYVTLSGKEQILAAGDMYMRDREGVISSVIYGPDRRTAISSTTQSVLYAVYAPPGVAPALLKEHLADIHRNVLLLAPGAEVELVEVYEAR